MTHRLTLVITALIPLLALGCTGSRSFPRADYVHGPIPHQARRTTDYSREAFWAPLNRTAYEALEHLPRRMSTDQDLVVREFGPPQWGREFESLEGEDVLEWLQVDQNRLFQFVEGELVFEGDIRDLEHTLLSHGVPDEVLYHVVDPGVERVTFIYSDVNRSSRAMYFDFSNGMMTFEERHP
ncbi:hypothetical protein JXA47_07955 [Candidatus Sumerlaeota bacterium]|nr:hypothetical protein [Candidatus Sumerlaeota bacterium]